MHIFANSANHLDSGPPGSDQKGGKWVGLHRAMAAVVVLFCLTSTSACFNAEMSFTALNASDQSGNTKLVFTNTYATESSGTLIFTVGPSPISPSPELKFTDLNGNLLTARTEVVELRAYRDSQCATATDQGNSFAKVSASGGVALFSGISNTSAGTYYLRAASTLTSGERIQSACSKSLLFLPGAAHHLKSADSTSNSAINGGSLAPMSVIKATAGGSSFSLRAQVVDQYGNPVVPASPISVQFSGFSSAVSGFSTTGTTDTQGIATLSLGPAVAMAPWAIFKAVASSGLTGGVANLLFPVEVSGGVASKVKLDGFPTQVLSGDLQYLKITPTDSTDVSIPAFASSVGLSTDLGATQSSVSFATMGGGSLFTSIGVTAGKGVNAYLNGATGGSGTSSLSPLPDVTVASTDCLNGATGPTVAVAAAGDWSNVTGWDFFGVPVLPTQYTTALIPVGVTKLVGPVTNLAGCVAISGTVQFQPSTTLQVRRAELRIAAGGRLLASAGTNEKLQFTRGFTEGPGPQRLVLPASSSFSLDKLEVAPAVTGGTQNSYAFFINSAGSSLTVNEFSLQANLAGDFGVYLNTQLNVLQNLYIPVGVEVVVNPGATLVVEAGAVIYGALSVRGGGVLKVGANQQVIVQSGGKFNLQGVGPMGQVSSSSGAAVVEAKDSAGNFSVAVSGGTLNASHFYISGLGRVGGDSGINIKPGSTMEAMSYGVFDHWDVTYPVITLGNAVNYSKNYLLDLHFRDLNQSLSSAGSVIDASNLSVAMGVLQSSVVTSSSYMSLKTKVSDPSSLIYWDF